MPISGFSERKFRKHSKIAAFSGIADVSPFTVDNWYKETSIFCLFFMLLLLVAKKWKFDTHLYFQ
jgi:hypothetical protein